MPIATDTDVGAPSYERLSAQDASFLYFERAETPMHVAVVAILEMDSLATAAGGVDAGRLAKYVESRLPQLPRYRRRLLESPIAGLPVWVDAETFQLERHIKRIAVPRPGDASSLKEIVGSILSQPLDRSQPLWEMWIVEGLERSRFALVSKVHHCMVDGASGVNLLTLLMSSTPVSGSPAAPAAWTPRPAPGSLRLLTDEWLRRTRLPLIAASQLLTALQSPRSALNELFEAGTGVAQALAAGLRRPVSTPINQPISRHRRVEWHTVDLEQVKAVKDRLGGTVNDVILTAVAGGLRRFLDTRGNQIPKRDYQVVIPVNMRHSDDAFAAANHVSALFLSLPLSEPSALHRYEAVRNATVRLKASRGADGIEQLVRFADWAGTSWLTQLGARLVTALHPYHLVVTNVPGPQMPLYVMGSRLVEIYPMLPLFESQGLGVAVMSYDGQIGCGLIGDRELVPDLFRFREALEEAFDELFAIAAQSKR